jgi:hypothetical protein
MSHQTTSGPLTALLLCLALLLPLPLEACSVPVFRYALEHWPADSYQAIVLHRGPLTPEQQALVRDLGPEGLAGQLHVNLALRTVNLDSDPPAEMLALSSQSALPQLVLRTPLSAKSPATLWSGELTSDTVRQLLDSPARREIVERLGSGESAVWVLVEGPDAAVNDTAAKLLETRLAYLDGVLTLPKLDPQDIVNGLVSIGQEDLRLDFSILRLSRSDSSESAFVQTLLGTEPDLREATEPIVIPIFGRGRALYAFVGAGIKHETIDQAATFLIGKCSCQVKELNPGADLLFAANWDKLVKEQGAAAPDLPTLAEIASAAPVTVTISTAQTPPASPKPNRSAWLYGACAAAVALLGAGLFSRRRAP